jgi:magnesium transporter
MADVALQAPAGLAALPFARGRSMRRSPILRERLTAAFEACLLLSTAWQKLASGGAILAVPAAIAGIYGMNFKNMPELEWSLGYLAAV